MHCRTAVAAGLALVLSACSQAAVTREQAKEFADDYFSRVAKKQGHSPSDFYPASIEQGPEGWAFTYNMKANPDRAYWIFVTKSGSTDVALTPDA